ncbi:MAG: LUD domain-containing protein [Thermoplasmata archaeon]
MAPLDYRARIRQAVLERSSLVGMRRAFETILERQAENADRITDLEARKERLRAVKERSVGDRALLALAMSRLRENGFRVVLAKTTDAATAFLMEEVKGAKLVVKSKSNVTKELHLADSLAASGVEVIETDLGDRIVQLSGCLPSHPTGPACHLTRRQISDLFSEHFGRPISDDPDELTRVMREEIASYLDRARIGITGANAIAANEGAVLIVHNEGNAARCAMVPDKHIIVTTPEKIVPDLDEAVNVARLQTYLSTGKIVSSYVNIVTGPSYTADIEKKVYRGMHGPRDVVVLIVDDGRLDAEDKEPQLCIGCGMCLVHCPTYNVVGPVFGSPGHMGGIGAYLLGSRGRVREAVESGLGICTACGACSVVCPSKIDTKKGIIRLRHNARMEKEGVLPEHESLLASLRNYDNPWQIPRRRKARWAERLRLPLRGDVLYFAGCSTSLLFPETADRAVDVIRSVGIDPAYLGQSEPCCGSTARKLGEPELCRALVEKCFSSFELAGAREVVTSCPGCLSALTSFEEVTEAHRIEIEHISQFLVKHADEISWRAVGPGPKLTYHDPCDLGREKKVFEEPRTLISKAVGARFVEMERTREKSACCGSGAGVKSGYPELAAAIGEDRVSMALETGAETIVTACPWCVQNLRDCQGDQRRAEVVDMVDLLWASIERKSG